MITKDSILAALGRLDPANEEHWTREGLPAVKALEELLGETGLTRAAVEEAAPGFTRSVASAAAGDGEGTEGPAAPEPAPDTTAEPHEPEDQAKGPAQPSPDQVAAALNSLDPAILREALKKVPAEALKEPVPEPEPPMQPVDLRDCNTQARSLDAKRVEREREVKRLVKDALKGKLGE